MGETITRWHNRRREAFVKRVLYAYVALGFATFGYLTFFDKTYKIWNLPVTVVGNLFLGLIWPIYWTVVHSLV